MSIFEFAFSLFGLLLGLSLAEVLGGAARSVEARKRTRMGWSSPLLAGLMVLDVVSFWSSAWLLRDDIGFSFRSMLGATAFAGAYYFAAYMVFPRDPGGLPDLDVHYLSVRRPVLGVILAANIVQLLVFVGMKGWAQIVALDALPMFGVFALLLVANMFTRGKAVPVLLAITFVLYFVQLVI